MFNFNPFGRKKPPGKTKNKINSKDCPAGTLIENQLEIKIENILVKITRCSKIPSQNELSAFIPRLEIRRSCYKDGRWADEEIVLNSITLVDAPRHLPGQTGRRTDNP